MIVYDAGGTLVAALRQLQAMPLRAPERVNPSGISMPKLRQNKKEI
jgi:hypothetical protein